MSCVSRALQLCLNCQIPGAQSGGGDEADADGGPGGGGADDAGDEAPDDRADAGGDAGPFLPG